MRCGRERLAKEEALCLGFLLRPRLDLLGVFELGKEVVLVQLLVLSPEAEVSVTVLALRTTTDFGRIVLRLMPAVHVRHGRVRWVERWRYELELLCERLPARVDHDTMPAADGPDVRTRRHRSCGEGLPRWTVVWNYRIDGDTAWQLDSKSLSGIAVRRDSDRDRGGLIVLPWMIEHVLF